MPCMQARGANSCAERELLLEADAKRIVYGLKREASTGNYELGKDYLFICTEDQSAKIITALQ